MQFRFCRVENLLPATQTTQARFCLLNTKINNSSGAGGFSLRLVYSSLVTRPAPIMLHTQSMFNRIDWLWPACAIFFVRCIVLHHRSHNLSRSISHPRSWRGPCVAIVGSHFDTSVSLRTRHKSKIER